MHFLNRRVDEGLCKKVRELNRLGYKGGLIIRLALFLLLLYLLSLINYKLSSCYNIII